jgi:hypothetical protein
MRKIAIFLLISALALIAAGCGGGSVDDGGGPGGPTSGSNEKVYLVNMCFVNSEYLNTGDEDTRAVSMFMNHHIFSPEGGQYMTLLDDVLRGGQFIIEGADTMITDKIQFNSVTARDGAAYVDMKGENLSGSSLEEGLLISQIVYSLISSFEEIEQVRFLIDGQAAESLMGHYNILDPFETGIHPLEM